MTSGDLRLRSRSNGKDFTGSPSRWSTLREAIAKANKAAEQNPVDGPVSISA